MARSKDKIEARILRKKGESIKNIAFKLNASVGSVSKWCSDIILTPKQTENLQKRVTDPYYGKKKEYLDRMRHDFIVKVEELKALGRKEIGKLNKRERFMIGIALYWAEGFKKDNQVGFSNTDPQMIKFFIRWLNEQFAIDTKDLILRVTANDSYKDDIARMEMYWSKELKVPTTQFSKPYFQKTIWKKSYENRDHYYGVLRVKVRRSVNLLRKMYGLIEGISSYNITESVRSRPSR